MPLSSVRRPDGSMIFVVLVVVVVACHRTVSVGAADGNGSEITVAIRCQASHVAYVVVVAASVTVMVLETLGVD